MKQFAIYFHDLTPDAQVRLLLAFNTSPEDESWDIVPLCVLEREEEEDCS